MKSLKKKAAAAVCKGIKSIMPEAAVTEEELQKYCSVHTDQTIH